LSILGGNLLYKSEGIYLNLKFNNFINLSSKDDKGDNNGQYVKSGRQVSGGNITFSNIKPEKNTKRVSLYTLNPFFGQFVADNFLVKGEIQALGSFDDKGSIFAGELSARYYFPISKKLFLYPELNVNYIQVTDFFGSGKESTTRYGGGLGASYFISNNVAIDVNIIKLQKGSAPFNTFDGSFGAENIRLLYFIR
jgi:hypothetical protein